LGFRLGAVVFNFCDIAVSQKQGEIELRSELITNMKYYVGFQLVQKSMAW